MSLSARGKTASIWPTTNWGRAGVGLFAGFVLFFAAFIGLAATGQKGGETVFDNLWLTIPGGLGGVCAVASFVVGGIGVAFGKERSLVSIFTTVIGLLATVFLFGELVTGDRPL